MDPFSPAQEPDEGYSEHPLNPSDSTSLAGDTSLTAKRSPADIPAWLSAQLPTLSVQQKTRKSTIPSLIPALPHNPNNTVYSFTSGYAPTISIPLTDATTGNLQVLPCSS